jgi:hypothetical protein
VIGDSPPAGGSPESAVCRVDEDVAESLDGRRMNLSSRQHFRRPNSYAAISPVEFDGDGAERGASKARRGGIAAVKWTPRMCPCGFALDREQLGLVEYFVSRGVQDRAAPRRAGARYWRVESPRSGARKMGPLVFSDR